ncbi:OmpA family protein [Flavobacterium hungaricum]|uniref:Flagellar motor protein MotB n=1 Tax=Flavobacterium hungaricum TaxID=2082725 RepID=A0ABR9TJB4_9FLAO|nr:OmpA family protein [Flavobacterium hungaricum]MBE8724762.1 flagellar motor protein MotB [Flavobacterium hungaricum]
MSKKALYLLGIAVTIILGTFLYAKFCCDCCSKIPADDTPNTAEATVEEPNFVPFVLNGPGIEYQTNDNLKFLKNSARLIMPVSDSLTIGIEKLKAFLTADLKQKVTITGYATSDETNSTSFENLALARANDIRNFFVSSGLSENQFDIKGEIVTNWKSHADTLLGPAAYAFADAAASPSADEWTSLKEKINGDPLILHFGTNKSSETLSDLEKQKVSDIAKYTEHVKEAVVLIVGYSDNVGNRDANIVLGQKRAEFSKNYLTKKGIDPARIETQSKGPDEPIGDNNTADGKASNRRTVITIK